MITIVTHQVSVEKLFHYRCHRCAQWWTIADRFIEIVACPSCGTKSPALKAQADDPIPPPPPA